MNWKDKQGRIVPIKNMTDEHLLNTIAYLDRRAEEHDEALMRACNPFGGEIAAAMLDDEQAAAMEEGTEPSDLFKEYDFLCAERDRRGIIPK